MNNFKIKVATTFDATNYGRNRFELCHQQTDRLPSGSMTKIPCPNKPVARYVVVEKSPSVGKALTFCEFEVYGELFDGEWYFSPSSPVQPAAREVILFGPRLLKNCE